MIQRYPQILFLLFLIFLASCSLPQKTTYEMTFNLRKTECYGTCPEYNLEVYRDGYSVLQVKKNLPLEEGSYVVKLEEEKLNALIESFNSSSFFSFNTEYSSDVSDLPTTYIYYSNGVDEKKIMDYYGAPEELKELEKSLENLIESEKWRKSKKLN